MAKPIVFVGAGTEVVVQAMLPTCQRILEATNNRWPDEVYVLMIDSDRRSMNRFREADLPEGRARYTHLSIHQLRESLARHPKAFRDTWREEWTPLLRNAPDNGASALPSLGRLMFKAALPTLTLQMEEFQRHMNITDDGPPDIFVVMNPLSGTSRGSVYELPRYLRAAWPGATVHALLVYPVGLERLDAQRRSLHSTNFIEALKIIEHYSTSQPFELYIDAHKGWEQHEGQLLDNILAFDSRYGNQRLKQLNVREFQLNNGLTEVMGQVTDFLAGVATHDRLVDALLGRLSNATMHRSRVEVAGNRCHFHALHMTNLAVEPDAFRRALIERGIAQVLAAFTSSEGDTTPNTTLDELMG